MQHITDRIIDSLGRIVIPKSIRNKLGIDSSCNLRIYEENGKIIIEKASPVCRICGSFENVNQTFRICEHCMQKIKEY